MDETKPRRLKLTSLILNCPIHIDDKKVLSSIKNPLLEEISKTLPKRKKAKLNENSSYEEMFSETNFHPVIAVELLKDLAKISPQNEAEKIVILQYALETVPSIFYSYDAIGKCKGIVEIINLLSLFPNTQFSNLVSHSITELFRIFIHTDERLNYNLIIQNLSDFLIFQMNPQNELLDVIFEAIYIYSRESGITENSFPAQIFALFSMLIVDKPTLFNESSFSKLFKIIEQYIYQLNEYALGILQHFHLFLSEETQFSFVEKLTTCLPGIIERGEPFMKVEHKDYVAIEIVQSPSSKMQFNKRDTFSKEFEYTVPYSLPPECRNLCSEESFPCFSLLFKVIGNSAKELETFLELFFKVIEQRSSTSYCLDYLGIYSLCLINIAKNLQHVHFNVPLLLFDPSVYCENTKSFYTMQFYLMTALLNQRNQKLFSLLSETVRFPLLFAKYVDIINEQIDLFVAYIKDEPKFIQELGRMSTQLQCANYSSEGNQEEIENARISLFRLFYSIFQRQGMLELFLNNQVFISFFLSLLFEEGIHSFAFAQLRLYLSTNNFPASFVSSLQIIIEQVACSFSSDEKYLNLLLKLVETLNKSVGDFSSLLTLCEPLSHVLKKLESSELSSQLIFTVAEFYLHCNSSSTTFNSSWFSAIGIALTNLHLKDKKTYECLVQLAAGNFVSKIEPQFILENPSVTNVMFMVFYETDIDVVSFLIKLCSFSDENSSKLHQCQLDILLLRYIKEHPELQDKNLLQLFCTIASISSSPAVVQMYLSLLTPMENRYVLSSLSFLINPLKTLIEKAQLSPEVYLVTCEENSCTVTLTQSIRNGFSLSCWLLADMSPTKLFRIKDSDGVVFLDVSCTNSLLCVNGQNVPCQIPRQRWSHLSILVQENAVSVFIDSNLIDNYEVPVTLKFSEICFIFGGSGNTKVTNISLSPPVHQSLLRKAWKVGMRYSDDLYNSLVFVSYKQITRLKPNMRKPFADILLRFFGIQILLPLLAHLDLKTKEGNESDLTAPIVISLLYDALMVGEKEELDFVEAGGTKIISHLLTVANTKHLTHDLYLSIYNIFEQVLSKSLQLNILSDLLLNFDLWSPAEPEELMKIIHHWTKHVFSSYTQMFLQVMPFKHLLANMRLYFWYTQLEEMNGSNARKRRSPRTDVHECRKNLNSLALKIASTTFTLDDFSSLLLHAMTLSDDRQKYDILCLLRDIVLLENSPISSLDGKKVVDSLSTIHTFFNTAKGNMIISAIEIIIVVHKKSKEESISLAEHLEVVFHIIASRTVTNDFVMGLCELLTKYPELFKIVSYFSLLTKSLHMYKVIKPSERSATLSGWCFWSVFHAIKYDETTIFDFLTGCGPQQWKSIYGCVESICRLRNFDRSKYCTQVLSSFLNFMYETKVDDAVATEIINICIQFILFHASSVNEALHCEEISSPFAENFEPSLKEEVKEAKGFDIIMSDSVQPSHNIFSLNIKQPNTWSDVKIAELLLKVVNVYPTKKNVAQGLIIAAFLSINDSNFVQKWLQETQLNVSKFDVFLFLQAKLKNEHSNNENEAFNAHLSTAYDDALSNSFVSVYENIKRTSAECFKKAMDAFGEDQSKSIDDLVTAIGQLSESIRTTKESNAKLWRRLWRNASVSGGPWGTERKEIKWKRDNSLCAGFYPCKMKPNKKFDLHIKASIARDTGNAVTAESELEKYENELKKKYAENAPPEVFEVDDEKEGKTVKANHAKLYSFTCELLTVSKVTTGKFNIYQGYAHIILDEKQKIHVINFDEIKALLYRRRFHHKTGIEIFLFGGKTYFINFPNDLSSTIVRRITEQGLPAATFIQRVETPQFFKSLDFTEKWVNNQMTNFEYLMRLNIFSGRTFNDPSQYPFFPWTLADFDRPELNLSDETVFRDLSKPVGCLGQKRMEELVQRMSDMKQFGQTPFLYSSFAICPLSLFLWNLRVEPFTSLHIEMQSGKFDHATRLFTSISDTFKLVTTHLNDYRELIPEFFFQSDFLVNENGFNLGSIRGERVGDVTLPSFVKSGSAFEFIYLMRKTLESEYVSAHLNEWIDLFWGVKQRGKLAEQANNLYNPNLYESIWTKENLKDPMKRASIEAAMCHVGQLPPQIFTAPHPRRQPKAQLPMIKEIANIHFESKPVLASLITVFDDYVNVLYSDGERVKLVQCMFATNEVREVYSLDFPGVSYISNSEILLTTKGKLAKIENNERVIYVEESLTSISHVTSCQRYHAIVSDEATLNLAGFRLRSVIPFYGECITCVSLSLNFCEVVCGTISGNIVYCSLSEATKVNAVPCEDFIPTHITITPSWGFVVVTGFKEENGAKTFSYNVYNINGKLLKRGDKLSSEVSCITSWSDDKGFDYVCIGCEDGKVFVGEAFYGFNAKARRCYSRVVSLTHCKDPECVISITENGALHFIPTNTEF